jgi:hypothetical protein
MAGHRAGLGHRAWAQGTGWPEFILISSAREHGRLSPAETHHVSMSINSAQTIPSPPTRLSLPSGSGFMVYGVASEASMMNSTSESTELHATYTAHTQVGQQARKRKTER